MCGIYALFNPNSQINEVTLQNGINAIKHRGPDALDYKIYANGHLGLAHARLSLVDLSDKANQPFETDEASIIFNGEIYNFRELKGELMQHGCTFTTTSDTEVLLKAITVWGTDKTLPKLNGCFACIIYDKKTEQLYVLRDHLGEKQLVYALAANGDWIIASEAKAILSHPYIKAEPNIQQLIEQLIMFAYADNTETCFKNIYNLPPASFLTFSKNNATPHLHKYWSTNTFSFNIRSAFQLDSSIHNIQTTMIDSVNLRIAADTPVGSILSGGLDSSYITALAAQTLERQNKSLTSFTVGYQDAQNKDIKNATLLAKQYKNINQVINIMPDLNNLDLLTQVTKAYEEPVYDKILISIYLNYKSVRQHHIKAVLNGQASDELWLGYLFAEEIFSLSANTYKKDLFTNYWLESSFYWDYFTPQSQKIARRRVDATLQKHFPFDTHDNYLNKLTIFGANTHLPRVLRHEDYLAMTHGVEVRLPFTDLRIIEQALHTDAYLKHYDHREKYLLRKAAQPVLPKPIITRKKMPFPHPPYFTQKSISDTTHEIKNSKILQEIFGNTLEVYKKLSLPNRWFFTAIATFEKTFF